MDKIKGLVGKLSGKKAANSSTGGPNSGQKDDYLDKGLAAAQKKMGMQSNHAQNEAMTDKGRELYEKQTGKKVSSKFSN